MRADFGEDIRAAEHTKSPVVMIGIGAGGRANALEKKSCRKLKRSAGKRRDELSLADFSCGESDKRENLPHRRGREAIDRRRRSAERSACRVDTLIAPDDRGGVPSRRSSSVYLFLQGKKNRADCYLIFRRYRILQRRRGGV